VIVLPTASMEPVDLASARALMALAWPDPDDAFDDDDWDHALGGVHAFIREDGAVVAHASVVPRRLWVGDRTLAVGYVEAVATRPDRQRQGLGSVVMRAIGDVVRERYELGALGTGEGPFYARLGWEPWLGETWVRRATGPERTPDDDGGIWVLRTPRTGPLDVRAPIACEERPGDDW
jgi:aminoglycoside 2'-N-acetyltransferase I